MAINRLRGDQPAPTGVPAALEPRGGPCGRSVSGGWRAGDFLGHREECVPTQGKKVDGPPLREGDRGIADPRQINPSEAAMVPPRTDRERLDDRPDLLTRGRDSTSRNQVRVRINGGKTAPTNERLLRMFAGAAEFCAVPNETDTAQGSGRSRRFCAPAYQGWRGRCAGDGLTLVHRMRCQE
jgi:hypothetical protein